MKQKMDDGILSGWLDLRGISFETLLSKEATKVGNVKYEGLQDLTRVYLNSDDAKYYFFGKGKKCVMIYINGEDELGQLSIDEITATMGVPEEIVRSRAGKRASHYIYSVNGFAFSELDGKIVFFEVFPDCSLADYKRNIYIEPPEFKR